MYMSNQGKKVVQTELSQSEYDTLASAAKLRKLTIKEAAREALLGWALSEADLTQDSLFRLRPTKFKLKVRADRLEEFLYRRR